MHIEETLWSDPQQQLKVRQCPRCGAEVYAPGYHCGRCRKETP